jgi:hypothetical protein
MNYIDAGAEISPCGTYRYILWRQFRQTILRVNFLNWIMLNPSTADTTADDATIRKIAGYTYRWGYVGLNVLNLFALRATNPRELMRHPDPVGPENERFIKSYCGGGQDIVLAWGAHGCHLDRARTVVDLLRRGDARLYVLGMTQKAQPKHPLYLPSNTPRIRFEEGTLCGV